MSPRRISLLCLLAACAGAECRADPTPACSYRQGGAAPSADAGVDLVAPRTFDVQAGDAHVCALVGDSLFGFTFARPRCWGGNELDQLSRRTSLEPGEGWWYDGFDERAAFGVGAAHACVTSESGEAPGEEELAPEERPLRCWGNNAGGQLGVEPGETISGLQGPVIPFEVREFRALSLGALHGCFTDALDVYCWGDDRFGQLGEGSCCDVGERVEPPDEVEGVWTKLAAGARHTCAIFEDPEEETRVTCWGDDSFGQLGDGAGVTGGMALVALPAVVDLASGPHHTCAVTDAGEVHCWGRGASAELGLGDVEDRDAPVRVDLPVAVEAVFAGGRSGLQAEDVSFVPGAAHTCALDAEGSAWCWGANESAQLGLEARELVSSPARVLPELRFDALALGGDFTCGILRDSAEVQCWGDNSQGQLGRAGDGGPIPAPAEVLRDAATTLDL